MESWIHQAGGVCNIDVYIWTSDPVVSQEKQALLSKVDILTSMNREELCPRCASFSQSPHGRCLLY